MNSFIDLNAPSLQGQMPKRPEDLPRGLITPPKRVLELIAREKAKFAPEIFTPETEARLLNEWTLQFYFDYLGYEVLYRTTPRGPEVLAVGFDEALAFSKSMSLEVRQKLQTWMP